MSNERRNKDKEMASFLKAHHITRTSSNCPSHCGAQISNGGSALISHLNTRCGRSTNASTPTNAPQNNAHTPTKTHNQLSLSQVIAKANSHPIDWAERVSCLRAPQNNTNTGERSEEAAIQLGLTHQQRQPKGKTHKARTAEERAVANWRPKAPTASTHTNKHNAHAHNG